VNRHQRRHAEAKARKQLGYWHRIAAAFNSSPTMADELRCWAINAVVEHDPWCGFYQHRPCSCTPNISLVPFDGNGSIFVVDEQAWRARTAGSENQREERRP
jgi:hypothetical protein